MRRRWLMVAVLGALLLFATAIDIYDCSTYPSVRTDAQPGGFSNWSTFESVVVYQDSEYHGVSLAEASMPIDEIGAATQGVETCDGSVQTDWDFSLGITNWDECRIHGWGKYADDPWDCTFVHILNWFHWAWWRNDSIEKDDDTIRFCDYNDDYCVDFVGDPPP